MADTNRIRMDANGARRHGSGGARRRSRSPVDRTRGRREDSRERHREGGGGNPGHPCRILVKNLPYETKWQIIKDIFRKEVGDVTFVDVLEGPDGRSKGVAMIEFKTKELAKKAIEKMHKFKVGDREIVVREERERDRVLFENQREREEMSRAMDMRGREMEMGLRGMDMGRMGMDMGRGAIDMGRGAMDMGRGAMDLGRDLGRDLDIGRGLDLGMRGGMDIALRGDIGMGMGLPSVGLGSLGGLGVNSAIGGGMGMGGGMPIGGGLMQGGGGGTGQPDINPEILAQLGIEGPITSQVFVANLDYKVTRSKLREVFALAGKVVHAELKEDKTGKSRGLGIVEFETPLEAVQAVSMFNGQVLFDRKMMVRIDKAIEDKAITKLPSGLKSIGMGLGSGGAPLTSINAGNSLGMSGGLGGLGMGGVGLGMDAMGGIGAGLGGAAGITGLQGMGSGLNNMGLSGSATGLGGSAIGLGQATAGLGLGGSGLGLGFGDSLGGGGLGGNKGMGDSLGMSGLGGGGVGLGLGGGMGSGGTMGGGGLGSSLDMQGSRVGYEGVGRGFDQPGGRVSRFDDNRGFDSKRGLDMGGGGRTNMDIQGRVGLEIGGRGGYDIGRGNLEAGMGMGRSGIDMPSQNRFENVGRGGIEGDLRGGFENNRGVGLGGLDMGRGGFDQIMRGSGNFDVSSRGARDLGGRGDMGGRVDIGIRGDMSGRGDMRGGRQPRTTVLVKNLPFSIGLQTLRDRFRDIGDLKHAEILTDMGRPSGEALLRFGAEEDALRAINLADGTRLEGRTIRLLLQP